MMVGEQSNWVAGQKNNFRTAFEPSGPWMGVKNTRIPNGDGTWSVTGSHDANTLGADMRSYAMTTIRDAPNPKAPPAYMGNVNCNTPLTSAHPNGVQIGPRRRLPSASSPTTSTSPPTNASPTATTATPSAIFRGDMTSRSVFHLWIIRGSACLLLACLIVGCGSDDKLARFKITGKVTFQVNPSRKAKSLSRIPVPAKSILRCSARVAATRRICLPGISRSASRRRSSRPKAPAIRRLTWFPRK